MGDGTDNWIALRSSTAEFALGAGVLTIREIQHFAVEVRSDPRQWPFENALIWGRSDPLCRAQAAAPTPAATDAGSTTAAVMAATFRFTASASPSSGAAADRLPDRP